MKQDAFRRSTLVAALLAFGIGVPAAALAAGAVENQPGGASAKPSGTVMSETKGALAASDKKFIEKAAEGGVAEVEMGKLASQKAQSAQVKQFGERMVKDHGAANDKLTRIAGEKGVTPASAMDSSAKREYDKLAKLSGAQFDQEYMKTMVSDHEKDVKEFQSEAKSAKDPQVKSFAENTLPTLEEHLKLAKNAQASAKSEKNEKTASK